MVYSYKYCVKDITLLVGNVSKEANVVPSRGNKLKTMF